MNCGKQTTDCKAFTTTSQSTRSRSELSPEGAHLLKAKHVNPQFLHHLIQSKVQHGTETKGVTVLLSPPMAICCTPRTLNGRNVEDNARAGAARTRMAVLRMLMRGYYTAAIGKDCAFQAADEPRQHQSSRTTHTHTHRKH